MVDAALRRRPPARAAGRGLARRRSPAGRWASTTAHLHRHPWILQVPISGPPITPNQVALDGGTGWPPSRHRPATAEKLSMIMLVSGYVRNWATLTADIDRGRGARRLEPADDAGDAVLAAARPADPARRLPALLRELLAESAEGHQDEDFDDEWRSAWTGSSTASRR